MQPLSARCMRILLRFRLGAHSLLVVVSCRTGTPRAQRLSQHCDQHAVGDERHIMFECPALQAVRDTMLHCLPVVQALQQVMWRTSLGWLNLSSTCLVCWILRVWMMSHLISPRRLEQM